MFPSVVEAERLRVEVQRNLCAELERSFARALDPEEEAELEEVEGSGGFLQSAMEEWEYSRGYLVYKAVPCRLVD